MDLPTNLFEPQSLLTYAGAPVATMVVAGALHVAFGADRRHTGFLTALVLMGLGAYATGRWTDPTADVVAFINACLVFLTAAGGSGLLGGGSGVVNRGGGHSWFGNWF
jgi:hypothetical protein